MPIVPFTGVHYVCDRCGFKTDNPNERGDAIKMDAQHPYIKVVSWLCGKCAVDWRNFLHQELVDREAVLQGWLRAARIQNNEFGSYQSDPARLTEHLTKDLEVPQWLPAELTDRLSASFDVPYPEAFL